MRVWVTGCNGQVGHTLLSLLQNKGIDCFGTTRQQADITEETTVRSFANKATHIVNAAASAQVDFAETNREEAYQVNTTGPAILAKIAYELGIRFLHISTDYVFDGTIKRAYREEDTPNPLNWYGVTKKEGELKVLQECPYACIVRTSWIFGGRGTKHYVAQVLDLVRQKKELFFVDDQIGRPTYAFDLAEALFVLLDASGIYHYSNQGMLSKYAFAQTIWAWAKQNGRPCICEQIEPIASSTFSAAARRPLYTPLDTRKIEKLLPIRSWQDAFAACMHLQSGFEP
jgi:dTDP-4-dehydrorhamnose reductase